MPATVITKEPFTKDVTREDLKGEIEIRIMAGAIRSWVEETEDGSVLHTEWNVFGQNDF